MKSEILNNIFCLPIGSTDKGPVQGTTGIFINLIVKTFSHQIFPTFENVRASLEGYVGKF